MLATGILVHAKLHVPIFCNHVLLVPRSLSSPLLPSIGHWALTSVNLFVREQCESAFCYCNNQPERNQLLKGTRTISAHWFGGF